MAVRISSTRTKACRALRASLGIALIAATLSAAALAVTLEEAGAAYERGDHEIALRMRLELAEQGNPMAQVLVGSMYARGHGVPRDDVEAVQWYRKAADQDHGWGQTFLGYMYESGRGVAKDDAEAVQWYRKAAERGFAMAQNSLGLMYERGRGVAQDDAEAWQWYRKAAEQGNASGQKNLARLAAKGRVALGASNCNMVQIDQWPVRLVRGHVIIDGAINGQKVGVMLDTGAMRTAIFRPVAARLGLKTRQISGRWIVGVGGDSQAEAADVGEFKIGGSVRKNWQMLVAGEHEPGDGIGAVLGEDFFQSVDVELDLAHNAVRLFRPGSCTGASLAYWASEQVLEVPIEAVNATRPRIVVPVRINGLAIVALFDTGASTSILNKYIASRLGVRSDSPGVVAAGTGQGIGKESIDIWLGPFESFEIGGETIRTTTIPFGEIGGVAQMILGTDFMRAHRLLVSHSQRKIYFTYNGGPVFQRDRKPTPAPPPPLQPDAIIPPP